MRAAFLIFVVMLMACEQLQEQLDEELETGEAPEVLTECEEGRTKCGEHKEFVWICENGWWQPYTDCYELQKTCVLFKGKAKCKGKGEVWDDDDDNGTGEQCEPTQEEPPPEKKDDIQLDDPIIEDPEPVRDYDHCYQGNFVVVDGADARELANWSCVHGDVLVMPNHDFINMQWLKEVTGSVIISSGNIAVDHYGASNLERVGKDIFIEGSPIGGLGFESLQEVGGEVIIKNNKYLRGAHLPSLKSFRYIEISYNPALTCVDGNFVESFDMDFHEICSNKGCGATTC